MISCLTFSWSRRKFKVIDGMHRVEAMKELLKEDPDRSVKSMRASPLLIGICRAIVQGGSGHHPDLHGL